MSLTRFMPTGFSVKLGLDAYMKFSQALCDNYYKSQEEFDEIMKEFFESLSPNEAHSLLHVSKDIHDRIYPPKVRKPRATQPKKKGVQK